ncbi:hypothetical protein BPAE_0134g00330 [Botrytis paeoniae]|uniref:Uncharacterized protein n=1 Tax=Botrytis paeoniae TaxID=278948 RepID=A0A4Z1FK25_9HELO|nr:hypothetical protein BPAE_0134g00330 [Botrytis paeoniae]
MWFLRTGTSVHGSKDVISSKWRYMIFNAPQSALAPTAFSLQNDDRDDGDIDQGGGSQFRKAFQEILEDPETYQKREDAIPTNEYIDNLKHCTAASGFLTNTFLVFDPVCSDLVVESVYFYDNMRFLAFEVKFSVPGKTYAKGYQGYTWVRLDQLVYYFYEPRMKNELGMDKIWEAAQESK